MSSSNEHTPEVRSPQMYRMTEAEAMAAGLYTVIDTNGVPTSEGPVETVGRGGRMAVELAAMVRKVLQDGFNPYRLEHVRDGLGEMHVDFDMLAEELRATDPTPVDESVPAHESSAGTAEVAAVLADELAAEIEGVLRVGFNRYRLVDVLDGLDVMADDLAVLASTLRAQETPDRGAA